VPIRDDGSADRRSRSSTSRARNRTWIALAQDGTMFVGCYRPDRVYRTPADPAEVFAEDPDGVVLNQPANVAFWGPDLDRLVVSSLGGWSLVAAPAGVRGLLLRYPSV
jgi:gluconolactonase